MIDMDAVETARAIVRAQAQTAEDVAVSQQVALAEHNRQMAVSGAAMIDAQQRGKSRRVAVHIAAVAEARVAKDHLSLLIRRREQIESKTADLRGRKVYAEQLAARCVPPSADDYPSEMELEAHRERRAGYDREVFRIAALISVEAAALDRALHAQWEAEAAFETKRQAEWLARSSI